MNPKKAASFFVGLSLLAVSAPSWGHELKVKGTIPLADVKATEWHSLAKIGLADAIAAAGRETKGKVIGAFLDHTDGYLTYLVMTTSPDKTETEFVIDAGNAQILSRQTEKTDASCEHSQGERD